MDRESPRSEPVAFFSAVGIVAIVTYLAFGPELWRLRLLPARRVMLWWALLLVGSTALRVTPSVIEQGRSRQSPLLVYFWCASWIPPVALGLVLLPWALPPAGEATQSVHLIPSAAIAGMLLYSVPHMIPALAVTWAASETHALLIIAALLPLSGWLLGEALNAYPASPWLWLSQPLW